MLSVRSVYLTIACLLGLSTQGALAADALEVTWPEGWTAQEMRNPAATGFPGSNQRAARLGADQQPQASIHLSSIQNPPGETWTLSMHMESAQRALRQVVISQGAAAFACDPTVETTLGGLPALESTCRASKGEIEVVQTIVKVESSGGFVHMLVYQARSPYFETYRADFNAVRASLRFTP